MSDERELTPADRELEAALRLLRPAPPVGELPQRAVAKWRGGVRRRRLYQTTLAAVLLVGGIGVWMSTGARRPIPQETQLQTAEFTPRYQGTKGSLPPPTVGVYRAAIAGSAAEFEQLLTRHGKSVAVDAEWDTGVSLLTLNSTKSQVPLGEM